MRCVKILPPTYYLFICVCDAHINSSCYLTSIEKNLLTYYKDKNLCSTVLNYVFHINLSLSPNIAMQCFVKIHHPCAYPQSSCIPILRYSISSSSSSPPQLCTLCTRRMDRRTNWFLSFFPHSDVISRQTTSIASA